MFEDSTCVVAARVPRGVALALEREADERHLTVSKTVRAILTAHVVPPPTAMERP